MTRTKVVSACFGFFDIICGFVKKFNLNLEQLRIFRDMIPSLTKHLILKYMINLELL